MSWMWKDQVTKEEVREALLTCNNTSEVIHKLFTVNGLAKDLERGTKISTLYRLIKKYGLEAEREIFNTRSKKSRGSLRPNEEIFVENSPVDIATVKRLLSERALMDYVCAIEQCPTRQMEGFWVGQVLALDLDHINGNNKDNRLENLRFLCKNCHGQTDTYCGKNKAKNNKEKSVRLCGECNVNLKSTARNKRCKECTNKARKSYGIYIMTKEAFQELINNYSLKDIKEIYNISSDKLRSRAKELGVELKPKGYW